MESVFNHFHYADDAIVLAPTPGALQKLIDVCQEFSFENEMLYNIKKRRCIAFVPSWYGAINLPKLSLGNNTLKWVDSESYLGAVVSSNLSDGHDIGRQTRAIYARGNNLLCKFRNCSNNIKLPLFNTYCYSCYMSHIWCNFKSSAFAKVKVAYNDIFRQLLMINRGESVSSLYVANNIHSFTTLQQKFTYSFYRRAMCSENLLVSIIVSSVYFLYASPLLKRINGILFIYSIKALQGCFINYMCIYRIQLFSVLWTYCKVLCLRINE